MKWITRSTFRVDSGTPMVNRTVVVNLTFFYKYIILSQTRIIFQIVNHIITWNVNVISNGWQVPWIRLYLLLGESSTGTDLTLSLLAWEWWKLLFWVALTEWWRRFWRFFTGDLLRNRLRDIGPYLFGEWFRGGSLGDCLYLVTKDYWYYCSLIGATSNRPIRKRAEMIISKTCLSNLGESVTDFEVT